MRFEFIYKKYVDDQDYTSNNYRIRKMFPINIKVLTKFTQRLLLILQYKNNWCFDSRNINNKFQSKALQCIQKLLKQLNNLFIKNLCQSMTFYIF